MKMKRERDIEREMGKNVDKEEIIERRKNMIEEID